MPNFSDFKQNTGIGVRSITVFADTMHPTSTSTASDILDRVPVINVPSSQRTTFRFKLPKRYDNGDLRARIFWSPTNTNTDGADFSVVFDLKYHGRNLSPPGSAGASWSDEVPIGTADQLQISDWSSWFTPDDVDDEDRYFQGSFFNDGGAYTGDIQLVAIEVQYNIDKLTDD